MKVQIMEASSIVDSSKITNAEGDLLPSVTVSTGTSAPKLNIVTLQPKAPLAVTDSHEDLEESYESSSEEEDGFYVEVSLACTSDDGDHEYHTVMLNFGSESNYLEHSEAGFDDFDQYFHDAIALNFANWEYADEWEETEIHAHDLPDYHDHDSVIIDII